MEKQTNNKSARKPKTRNAIVPLKRSRRILYTLGKIVDILTSSGDVTTILTYNLEGAHDE